MRDGFKTAKLTCENGYTWKTSVSAESTDAEIQAYFIGAMFNTASYPKEVMSKCIKCEILKVEVT